MYRGGWKRLRERAGGDEAEVENSLFTRSRKRDLCNSHGMIDLNCKKQWNPFPTYLGLSC